MRIDSNDKVFKSDEYLKDRNKEKMAEEIILKEIIYI